MHAHAKEHVGYLGDSCFGTAMLLGNNKQWQLLVPKIYADCPDPIAEYGRGKVENVLFDEPVLVHPSNPAG
jgi:hypothetical protein